MSDETKLTFCGIRVIASPSVPLDEVWLCSGVSERLEIEGATVRLIVHYHDRVVAKIR